MQKLVKTGKNTKINKQSDVKFWLNCIKYGAVPYSLSCTPNHKYIRFLVYEYSNQFAPRKSFIPKFDYEKKEGKKKGQA